jgi:hypothetical protein
MPDRTSYDYAVVRVVPLVDRGEFLNVGVILFCRTRRYLKAQIELDVDRLSVLAPWLDGSEVQRHLAVIPQIAAGDRSAGPMAELPLAGRFHWLVAPRSTVVQMSPVHSGLGENADEALDDLMTRLVRPIVDATNRQLYSET